MKKSLFAMALALFISYPVMAEPKAAPAPAKCEDLAPKEVPSAWTKTYKFGFYENKYTVDGQTAVAYTNDNEFLHAAMRCDKVQVILPMPSGDTTKTIYRDGRWFSWGPPKKKATDSPAVTAAAAILLMVTKIRTSPERPVSGS